MGKEKEKSGWFNEFQKLNRQDKPAPPPKGTAPPPRKNPPAPLPAVGGKDGERRAHPRFDVDEARATLYREGLLTKVGLGKSNKARFALNLSEGGVRMLVNERVAPGTRVHVRIEMEKYQDAIEAAGEVRWCFQSAQRAGDFYAGVMFVDLDEVSRRKIQMMRDWFTSPQYRVVRETKARQRQTPSDIIRVGK